MSTVVKRFNPYFFESRDPRLITLFREGLRPEDRPRVEAMRRQGTLPLTSPLRYAGEPLFAEAESHDPGWVRKQQLNAVGFLCRRILWRNPQVDIRPVLRAGRWAILEHEKGEKATRRSGEPYINHPLRVSNRTITIAPDPMMACLGLLHDVKEDHYRNDFAGFSRLCEEIFADFPRFAPELERLIDGVTKLILAKEQTLANWNKYCAEDNRPAIAKLADRVDNNLDFFWMPEDIRRKKSKEVQQVYAPAAYQLGLWRWRCILLDTSLRDLNPEIYWPLVADRADKLTRYAQEIENTRVAIEKTLQKEGIGARVITRPRRPWDIYRTATDQRNEDIPQVHPLDLMSYAVVLESLHPDSEAVALWRLARSSEFSLVDGTMKDHINNQVAPFYQAMTGRFIHGGFVSRVKFFNQVRYQRAMRGVAAAVSHFPPWPSLGTSYFQSVAAFSAKEGIPLDHIGEASERLIGGISVIAPDGKVYEVPRGKKGEIPTVLDALSCLHSDLPARVDIDEDGRPLIYLGGGKGGWL